MHRQMLIVVVLLILIIIAVVYAMKPDEQEIKTFAYEIPIIETPTFSPTFSTFSNLYPTGSRFRTYPQNIYPRIEDQTTFVKVGRF